MCRDGFRAPCGIDGCTGEAHCRDRPLRCRDHALDLWAFYEEDAKQDREPILWGGDNS